MAAPKLTAQQKRDREWVELAKGIQKEYEDKIARMEHEHGIELAKLATENYVLGFEQGHNAAEAVYQAQSVLDRLLKKAI